jgi:hypothetical protein
MIPTITKPQGMEALGFSVAVLLLTIVEVMVEALPTGVSIVPGIKVEVDDEVLVLQKNQQIVVVGVLVVELTLPPVWALFGFIVVVLVEVEVLVLVVVVVVLCTAVMAMYFVVPSCMLAAPPEPLGASSKAVT